MITIRNLKPGSLPAPAIEINLGFMTISRERAMRIINLLNRWLTGRE